MTLNQDIFFEGLGLEKVEMEYEYGQDSKRIKIPLKPTIPPMPNVKPPRKEEKDEEGKRSG